MVTAVLHPILSAEFGPTAVLAQTARTARNQSDIWLYLIVLVVAAMVIVLIGLILRKLFLSPIEADAGEAVFDLSELRRLHREGQLSDEEFQVARAAAIRGGSGFLADEGAGSPQNIPTVSPDSHDIELGPELLSGDKPPENPDESDKPSQDR